MMSDGFPESQSDVDKTLRTGQAGASTILQGTIQAKEKTCMLQYHQLWDEIVRPERDLRAVH